ncbi:MAG: hypothetical protein RLY17_949, partial [Pseudomonadota bacterium]
EGGRNGLKGKSKAKAFYEFVAGMRGEIAAADLVSDFSKHEVGATLTSAIYQSICHGYHQFNPLVRRRFVCGKAVYIPDKYAYL